MCLSFTRVPKQKEARWEKKSRSKGATDTRVMEARLALIGRKREVSRLFGTCDERVRLLCANVEHFSFERVTPADMVAVVRMTGRARAHAARRASVGGVPTSSRAYFYECYPLHDLAVWMRDHAVLPNNRATLVAEDRRQIVAAAGLSQQQHQDVEAQAEADGEALHEEDLVQLDDLARLANEDLASGGRLDLDDLEWLLTADGGP